MLIRERKRYRLRSRLFGNGHGNANIHEKCSRPSTSTSRGLTAGSRHLVTTPGSRGQAAGSRDFRAGTQPATRAQDMLIRERERERKRYRLRSRLFGNGHANVQ